MTTVITSMI